MQTLGASGDSSGDWATATHVGGLDWAPGPSFGCPIEALVGIWGVNQWKGALSVHPSLSLSLRTKQLEDNPFCCKQNKTKNLRHSFMYSFHSAFSLGPLMEDSGHQEMFKAWESEKAWLDSQAPGASLQSSYLLQKKGRLIVGEGSQFQIGMKANVRRIYQYSPNFLHLNIVLI